ncbi:MAG: extensin family protein [Rhodobiaceae bacterium]|nr:extensin family protein [Rhodobiaceae bacterium]MCC0040834.1 extensin family protein [Rhodobiaceae bacterium]MCC0053660.1 extensin family protein [Rhodobiaceae bacterium]
MVSACAGPGVQFVDTYAPWRKDTELACLQTGLSYTSAFASAQPELDGPRNCGAIRPLRVNALAYGAVTMQPPALVRCPMVPALDDWVRLSVLPAARQWFGQDVVEVENMASYSCRPRNNKRGAKLSEHGFANAIDVGGFTLADGRKINVRRGWNGDARERGFLRAVYGDACQHFSTTLGPDSNKAHHDHFHFDLARYGKDGGEKVCR